MSAYIDRDAIMQMITEWAGGYSYIEVPTEWAEEKARKLSAADVVEVVRCKDCKWYKTNYTWNGKEVKVCVIEPYEPCRNPNDYCSRGERKDGADGE